MLSRLVMTGSTGFIGQEILQSCSLRKSFDIRTCYGMDALAELGSWAEGATLLHLAGRFSV